MCAPHFSCSRRARESQAPKEPSWPQPFQVLQGENASFGFVVSQPGPISVNVTSQGTPVSVELSGPIAQPIRKSGTGAINITVAATAADVQKSEIWLVRISAASPAQPMKNRAPQVVASGTISVQHPPGKMSIAAKPGPHRAAAPTHAAIAPSSGAASLIAAYQADLAAKQKAEQERLQRLVSATPVAASATRMPLKHAPSVPKITSLSVSSGQPSDYLLIHGVDLGRDGEVHFVVAPSMDLKTMANAFGDTLIMVHVPAVTGIGPYSGQIYVKLTGQHPAQTNALPFAFVPTMDFVDLRPNVNDPDARIDHTALASVCPADGGVCRDGSGDFLGHKGNDIFYATKMLKNGWVVQDANANGPWQVEGFGSAGNYLVDSRPGTAYPYAKVHWWIDALTSVNYAIVVVIKGPKGLPYQ